MTQQFTPEEIEAMENNPLNNEKTFEEECAEIDAVFGEYDSFEEFKQATRTYSDELLEGLLRFNAYNDRIDERQEVVIYNTELYHTFNNYKESNNSIKLFSRLFHIIKNHLNDNGIIKHIEFLLQAKNKTIKAFIIEMVNSMYTDEENINNNLDFQNLIQIKKEQE